MICTMCNDTGITLLLSTGWAGNCPICEERRVAEYRAARLESARRRLHLAKVEVWRLEKLVDEMQRRNK